MRSSSHGGTCLLGHNPTERPQYHDDLECWGCKKERAFLGPPNQEEAPQAQKDPWLAWLSGIKAWQAGYPIQGWRYGIHVASSRNRGPRYAWGPVSRACPETRPLTLLSPFSAGPQGLGTPPAKSRKARARVSSGPWMVISGPPTGTTALPTHSWETASDDSRQCWFQAQGGGGRLDVSATAGRSTCAESQLSYF